MVVGNGTVEKRRPALAGGRQPGDAISGGVMGIVYHILEKNQLANDGNDGRQMGTKDRFDHLIWANLEEIGYAE